MPIPDAPSAELPTRPDDPRGPRRSIERDAPWFRAFLVGLAAVGPFSLNVFSPCLPYVRQEFRASLATVQLSSSLSILASAVATVLAGPLTDRAGRRPILIGSLALYGIGSVTGALSPDLWILIAGRLVQAASSSVAFVTTRALIHDVYGSTDSARVIARVSLVAVLAVILAPILGGLLIESFGWRSVFVGTSALGVALFGAAHGRVPETSRTAASASSWGEALEGIARLVRAPRFHGFAMPSSLHFATFFAFTSSASYVMVETLHQGATGYGIGFLLLSVFVGAGLVLAERLSGRVSHGRLAFSGSVVALLGAAACAFVWTAFPLTPVRLFLPVSLAALGIGLAVPGTNAGVMSIHPRFAGTASGLMGFEQYLLAAMFAQLVVHDEPRAMLVLATATLGGCGLAAALATLALGEDTRFVAPEPFARVEAETETERSR